MFIVILLAVAIVVAMYVHSRVKEGVGIFEITAKDKAAFQEFRREFGICRILARLIGGISSLLFIGGMFTLLENRADWRISAAAMAISVVLFLSAMALLKGSKR